MTKGEAIDMCMEVRHYLTSGNPIWDKDKVGEALDMAIEALQFVEHFNLLKEFQSLQEVVWCKDCQHANECHKSIQYTRNEPNTVTIGYSPIEWCSKGERSEE